MSHGTTDVCGPACDTLLAAKNGPQRHRFCVELAVDLDRKRAFYDAGYKAEAWQQGTTEILSNPESWGGFAVHSGAKDQGSVDWGTELRALERGQAAGTISDVMDLQEPDSRAIEKLRNLCIDGKEDREKESGFRPATDAEVLKASQKLMVLRPKPFSKLTKEQISLIESIEIDRYGKIKYDLGRAGARARSAKIEGLNLDQVKVTYQEAKQDQIEIMTAYRDAIQAEIEARGLPEDILQAVLERVKAAKGGG